MSFHVGDKVRFVDDFCEDPYQFVGALEGYDQLDVSGGGKKWTTLLKAAKPIVTIVGTEHIHVKYRLEGYDFDVETVHFPEELELLERGEPYRAKCAAGAAETERQMRELYGQTLFDLMDGDNG